jgi:UPF0716 protein FxsA
MNPWLILVLVVYPVLEWITASWLAGFIGWGGVVLVVLVLILVGVGVMRRAGFAAARSLRPVSYDGATVIPATSTEAMTQVGRDVGDAGALFVAGFLIALPGLVTSAVGLVLLVPPVRRWARGRFARSVRRRAEAAGVVFDSRTTITTVQGDVLREDDRREDIPPARGEILSGEIVRDTPDGDPPDGAAR